MRVTYQGDLFTPVVTGRQKVERLQEEVSKMPQFEPDTRHTFHGGMYCREVFRPADTTIIGKVHKKEHFYLIVSGTVLIMDGVGAAVEVTGPKLISSRPGTKRAVYSVTDALCMTFHALDAVTVEDAEAELVEDDPVSMFAVGNKVKLKEIL